MSALDIKSGKRRSLHRILSTPVHISIIIPSTDGYRNGNVPRLLEDIEGQTIDGIEVIVVVGVRPQGKAINQGFSQSRGEYLVILDDDSRLLKADTISRLVAVLKEDSAIGMVGASIVQPKDASLLQRKVASEFPRFDMPIVHSITESDMPCHGCCAFHRDVFKSVGQERENIIRGLDPDLRQRIRDQGYRIILCPGTAVSHPVPGTIAGLAKMFLRNGYGSAFAQRHHPEFVYDTLESETTLRVTSVPFIVRMIRFPVRSLSYLLRGNIIRFMGDPLYLTGYLYGLLDHRKQCL